MQLAVPSRLTLALALGLAASGAYAADYSAHDLSSLGGTISRANSINTLGWISGYSNLAGNQSRHASLWLYGHQIDLGTLVTDAKVGGFSVRCLRTT